MKSDAPRPGSALGYLASFALGIICLGMILIVLRDRGKQASEGDSPAPPVQLAAEPAGIAKEHPERSLAPPEFPETNAAAKPGYVSGEPAAGEAERAEALVPVPAPARSVDRAEAAILIANESTLAGHPNSGSVSGMVLLNGEAPPEKSIPMDPFCAAKQAKPPTTRFYVVGENGGLADVIVSVAAEFPRQRWPLAAEPLVLKLRACNYENYINAVLAGRAVQVQNEDDVLHNVHQTSSANGEVNRAVMPNDALTPFVFSQPEEFIRFKCDVHPWEFAYVTVFAHPFFAVTDGRGNFQIQGLPPGNYTLRATHRKSGVQEQEITVVKNQNTNVVFRLEPRPSTTALNFP